MTKTATELAIDIARNIQSACVVGAEKSRLDGDEETAALFGVGAMVAEQIASSISILRPAPIVAGSADLNRLRMTESSKAGHREHHVWGTVSYWHGNSASDRAAANRVRVEVGFGLNRHDFTFPFREGAPSKEVADLMLALDIAVELGDRHARAEMRACMGIKE